MANTIAGIAPQVDTHTNWNTLNPTLGLDEGGKSYGQVIFSTGSPVGDILIWGNAQTYSQAYAAGQYVTLSSTGGNITVDDAIINGQLTLGYMNSRTVTANATLGAESVLNVNAGTAAITITDGLPVGTRKRLRKISGVAGTVTYNFSGTESVTRAGLTSITSTSDGDFWDIEKVTSTRWELVDGVELIISGNDRSIKYKDGSMTNICRLSELAVPISTTEAGGFRSASLSKTYLTSFVSIYDVSAHNVSIKYLMLRQSTTLNTGVSTVVWSAASTTEDIDIIFRATGRWYS